MTQCSEQSLNTPRASDLYQNGVEMYLRSRVEPCTRVAIVTYQILGKRLGYCAIHAEQKRKMVSEMVAYGIPVG